MFKYGMIMLCGFGVGLPMLAHSESYDRSLEVTAPGEWMNLNNHRGEFRLTTRCLAGEKCWNMGRSTLVSVKAPEGWELKWGTPAGNGTQTVLQGTAVSGGVIMFRCAANSTTNTYDEGTYSCSRQLFARRVSTMAGNGAAGIAVKMDFVGTFTRSYPVWEGGFEYRNGVWEHGSLTGFRNEPQYQPKIARLDYSSHVRFTKGEQVKFLKITASTSTARLQVNISGPGANVLTLGNSDTGVIGLQACDGTIRTGMTCFITTKNNIEWYGEKKAIATITLSVT